MELTRVFIQNDDGSLSGYAHVAAQVWPGLHVDEGGVIGRADPSGRTTGGHLHYTYRDGDVDDPATLRDQPIDPADHLRGANPYPCHWASPTGASGRNGRCR